MISSFVYLGPKYGVTIARILQFNSEYKYSVAPIAPPSSPGAKGIDIESKIFDAFIFPIAEQFNAHPPEIHR